MENLRRKIKNKAKLSIGAKQLTNKERDKKQQKMYIKTKETNIRTKDGQKVCNKAQFLCCNRKSRHKT